MCHYLCPYTIMSVGAEARTPAVFRRFGLPWAPPSKKLMRLFTRAVMQWDIIQHDDRLLLGLSGGKDSLAFLHVLVALQRKLLQKFELEVCVL